MLPLVLSLHASSLFLYVLQEIYSFLAQELKSLASAHGERLLHTPHNPISLGKTSRSTILSMHFAVFWVSPSDGSYISDPILVNVFKLGYLM